MKIIKEKFVFAAAVMAVGMVFAATVEKTDAETQKKVKALSTEINAAKAKKDGGASALKLYGDVLALPLSDDDRIRWLEGKAYYQMHVLRQDAVARTGWDEAVKLRKAKLAGKTGLERAGALGGQWHSPAGFQTLRLNMK